MGTLFYSSRHVLPFILLLALLFLYRHIYGTSVSHVLIAV